MHHQSIENHPVAIVGAGLAGLACALHLKGAGQPVLVLESSDDIGGRIRTDVVTDASGRWLIDRGFQVYLSAYPEGRGVLDLDALGLGRFSAGARVWADGRFHPVADPLRHPTSALAMLRSPLLSPGDAVAIARLDLGLRFARRDTWWEATEQSTEALLRDMGISDRAIDRLFRPFFGGVFLDRSLQTSARKFRMVYHMFAHGFAALPKEGMQAIPRQIASYLPPDCIRPGAPVTAVTPDDVTFADGTSIPVRSVVIATDAAAAARLIPGLREPRWTSTTSLCFAADRPPTDEPTLYLDGDGLGPVNHVAMISNAQPTYAPAGRALISASIVAPHLTAAEDETNLVECVRAQMRTWFGSEADDWQHLRTSRIRHALPDERAPALATPKRPVITDRPGVFIAGDHLDDASINGALESGRRAAEAVLRRLA